MSTAEDDGPCLERALWEVLSSFRSLRNGFCNKSVFSRHSDWKICAYEELRSSVLRPSQPDRGRVGPRRADAALRALVFEDVVRERNIGAVRFEEVPVDMKAGPEGFQCGLQALHRVLLRRPVEALLVRKTVSFQKP